jgi:hypothetical protein
MDYINDEIEEFMNHLEESGVLEWVGMTTDGERTFVFNFEKMYHVFPELYHAMMEELNNELLNLYELGMVTIEYDVNLSPSFKITEEGKKYLEENGVVLPEELE